uniref:cysteine synthase n=1 Tax=Hanusia phi TaxID=3032 RepID=A0A7S0E0D1_9CRYP
MFRRNPNLRVLDVREDKEAENMPIPSWFRPVRVGRGVLERDVVGKLPNLEEEILCVCAGGSRSVKAAQVMQEMGYKKVYSLKEGAAGLCKGHPLNNPKVKKGFLETVGNTPLIRLNKLSELTGCEILGKAEFMNPGGSVKDRPALQLILDAERRGLIKPGATITEATSGNTGIGLAHVCNARGYKLVVCMPKTMSLEKQRTLKQLGAKVILTEPIPLKDPVTGKPNMDHYHNLAPLLAKQGRDRGENIFCVNQWQNTANREAHYLTTGPEILQQTGGKIDCFCAATGTGGTIGGISRYLKDYSPKTKVVLVDCFGSALHSWATTGDEGTEKVLAGERWCPKPKMSPGSSPVTEGIGNSIITANMEGLRDYIDDCIQIPDADAIRMVFRLLYEEAIFVGGSAALNVCAAVEMAKRLGPGHTIVTILCDSGFRYGSKFFNKQWMQEKQLYDFLPPEHREGIE